MSPGHQSVDVLFEMPIGQLCLQIAQVGIGLDAVHATGSDQAVEACPTPGAVIVTCKKCIATCHGWASDRIFDQVGIHVDMAIVEEQTKASLTSEHIGQRFAQFGLSRDTGRLGTQPGKEYAPSLSH